MTRGALNFNRLISRPVAVVEEVETRAGGKAVNPWQTWGTLTLRGGRLHVKCQEERQKPRQLNKIEGTKMGDVLCCELTKIILSNEVHRGGTLKETLDKGRCLRRKNSSNKCFKILSLSTQLRPSENQHFR